MKTYLVFIALAIVLNIACATAQTITIQGKICNSSHQPVEYANLQLLDKDSLFIKGATSDAGGNFKLTTKNSRAYRLLVSATGYIPASLSLENVQSDIELGEITLPETTIALEEVSVTANRTVHKIDRQITYPSPIVRESSNNALEVLYKSALPKVVVNPTEKTISLIGNEAIKLRINGIDATVNEVAAIPAKEIIRIDYYDNPGVLFEGKALIDLIVKRRESGGYFYADVMNSPHVGFGNNQFSTKFNYKNSEWSANYYLSYRSYKKRELEETKTFNFPDEPIVRQTECIPSRFGYQMHDVSLSYNYTLPDKRVFNASFIGSFSNNTGHDQNYNLYSNLPGIRFLQSTETASKETNPQLDLYYKEVLSSSQTLMFNLVGGYINSTSDRENRETDESGIQLSNFLNNTTGKKYSAIVEGIHQAKWDHVQLHSGVNFKTGYAENNYAGDLSENTTLNNSDLYIYTQLQGKIKKFGYQLGIGVSNSYFSDRNNRFNFWTIRPTVSLSYHAGENTYFQYKFRITPYVPSLSSLSDVAQRVDQFTINKGNPDLKPYRIYFNQLTVNFQKSTFQCYASIAHAYYNHVIMNETEFNESEKSFVSYNINQNYFQKATLDGSINWQIIPDKLSLNLYGQIHWSQSKGIRYDHKYTGYYGNGQINYRIKQWSFNFGINSRYNSLWSEYIFYGEWSSMLGISYKYKELNVGITGINILSTRWSAGNKNLSRQMPGTSWTYIYDSAPIYCLNLSWNINWGKKSKAEQKTLQNKDSDSGIFKVK